MVDYYVELGIDKSAGIEEINKQMSKLENVWRRRELSNPEKATKMLAIIIDAREVFKSVQTKSVYDHKLAECKKPSKSHEQNNQKKDAIQKWKSEADIYYNRGEYDLAKIAINRALVLSPNSSDDELYSYAAKIYMKLGAINAALNFVNNAIIINPQNGLNYLVKANIYGHNASEIKHEASRYYGEKRKALQIGLNLANSARDSFAKGQLLGALAFSLYFEPNQDRAKAEALAKEALALGESSSDLQKVLDAIEGEHQRIKQQREAAEKLARQREEQEEVRRQAEEKRREHQLEEEQRQKEELARGRRNEVLSLLRPIFIIFIYILILCVSWMSKGDIGEVIFFGGIGLIGLIIWIILWF